MMESLPRWVMGTLSMGVMCCARAEAYRAIERAVAASNAAIADAQAKLKDACSLADYAAAMTVLNGTNVWTVALQRHCANTRSCESPRHRNLITSTPRS